MRKVLRNPQGKKWEMKERDLKKWIIGKQQKATAKDKKI